MAPKRKITTPKKSSNKAFTSTYEDYDHTKFMNLDASKRYTSWVTIRKFIKEKGFEHPEDFFCAYIANKGWKELCKPPKLAVMSMVREFYSNLCEQVTKKVWVRGKWVSFDSATINEFYKLPRVDDKGYQKLCETPDYIVSIKC